MAQISSTSLYAKTRYIRRWRQSDTQQIGRKNLVHTIGISHGLETRSPKAVCRKLAQMFVGLKFQIHTHTHTHTHTPTPTHTHTHTHTYIYIHTYIHTHTHIYTNIHIYRVIRNDCRCFNNCHLVLQMQPHVISFYGVTSRIRFMFLLFPQISRNRRYESEPPLKPSPLTCYKQFGTNSIIVLMFVESQLVHI